MRRGLRSGTLAMAAAAMLAPAGEAAQEEALRLNDIAAVGTHNSYK